MISKVIGETFEVTSSSIFSKIISKELFTKANSLKGILDNGARIITPVFGIFLYKKFGIGFIFLFNAFTFLVSGISEIFITYTHTKVSSLEELKIEKVLDSSTSIEEKSKLKVALDKIIKITGIHNYKDVFKFILNDKILTNFMIFIVLANFILAPLGSTLFPFVALKRVGISEYQYSIANTMSVVASILASSLLLYKKREPDIRGLIIKNSFVFLSIGLFGGLAARFNIVTPYFYLYSLLYFLMGGIGTLINIPLMSTLQKLLPPEMQGRFFAVLSFIGGLLVPLGITIFSNIANYILAEYIIVVNSLVLLFIISRLDFDIHKGEKVV
jgi:MFS family permease